jgi:urate oxidase
MSDTLINNTKALEDYIVFLRASFDKHKSIKVSVKSAKTRTLTQNSSIHKYCAQLAEAFNDAGLDMNKVLSEGTSIPWSEEKVKSDIWKVVQLAAIGKESTTKLETNEVSKVYDIVNRHISQTFGIFIPFPSRINNDS